MTDSGIRCPNCNCGHHHVDKTHPSHVHETHGKRVTTIKRERVCRHCKTRWPTIERNEEDLIREESEAPNPFLIHPDMGDEP